MKSLMLLFLSVVANSGANFLLLHAADLRHSDLGRYSAFLVLTALVLGLSAWCYAHALRKLPLSVAYPTLTGGAIILVAVADHVSAENGPNLLVGGGIVCVVVGIVALGTPRRRSPKRAVNSERLLVERLPL